MTTPTTTPTTELSKAYDPSEVETRWYKWWLEKDLFRADPASGKPAFSIVLPPPNVTGSLHIGHALTATIEDILVRWKRMSGFEVLWLPGTDHAGIATQMVVERELKKTEGKSRHDLGRERFLERVWAWKEKYGHRIREQMSVMGSSCDWSRERFTMDPGVSRAVREVFVRLHDEGLIYRAQKLINWCPSCRTALSDLEVEHEEKQGSLWHIKYPVVGAGSDRHLVVATTRPETMLGDTAVAIHPDDPRYAGLAGGRVRLPLVEREIPIVADAELVQMEFGTGVVKVTPAHDFNDYATGLRHKLPMVSILDEAARVNKEGGAYAGLDRFEARKRVLADLTERGLLEKEEPHKLNVGTCQRCSTVVEPRLSPQWFVKIEPLARPAIEAVESGRTKILPETWTNVYFHWMRNIHDWCISRQLWWGHQIPAWYCEACSPREGDDTDLPLDAPTVRVGGIDFARATPIVSRDTPTACPKCGGNKLVQDADVLDTWFSSGLWPFSTMGWPEQTADLRKFYPNSVMETGHDILFFWVARMMMMGLKFMGDVPFRTVFLHAMVRDEKGDKMSKTKGNVVDPLDIIQGAPVERLAPSLKNKFPQGMPAFGADAMRFTLAALSQQGRDIKLSMDRVAGYKAFGNKLWNASRFALMNMGEFHLGARHPRDFELTLADRWILSRLERTVRATREALEAYDFGGAASGLYQFLWGEFCDWYIELCKSALYGEDAAAKDRVRAVLVFCLDRILRLLHPLMPFITEEIWQKLPMDRPTASICVAAYPEPDARLLDEAAEAEMAPVVAAIEGLRNIRGESNLAPSAKVVAHAHAADAGLRASLERYKHYVMPLAGLSELRVSAPGAKPAQAAAWVGPGLELYLPLAGLIDFAAERERLKKEMQKVDQDLNVLGKKLDNPNFVAKAPPDVVETDRARREELKTRRVRLEENLARLSEPEAPVAPTGGAAAPAAPAPLVDATPTQRVDLAAELQGELARAEPPAAAPEGSAPKLTARAQGGEKLSKEDHKDLGAAFMSMGLVEQAVREFAEAGVGAKSRKEQVTAAVEKTRSAVKKAVAAVKKAAGKAAAAGKAGGTAARGSRGPAGVKSAPAKGMGGAKAGAAAKKAGAAAKRAGASAKAAAKKAGARAKVAAKKAAPAMKKAGVKAKAAAVKARGAAKAAGNKARGAAKKASARRPGGRK